MRLLCISIYIPYSWFDFSWCRSLLLILGALEYKLSCMVISFCNVALLNLILSLSLMLVTVLYIVEINVDDVVL